MVRNFGLVYQICYQVYYIVLTCRRWPSVVQVFNVVYMLNTTILYSYLCLA